jgi:hypothetical protein
MKIFAISRLPRRLAALGILSALAASVLVPAAALAAPAQAGACGGDVKCILAFGDARIAERQAALTKLGTKIGDQLSKGHITSAQAAPLQAQVTQSQGDMTAIKTKLDAETTAAAARQDVHDIYWKYRIFAVVIPKTTRKAFYDVTTNVDAKLKGLEPKIEDAISKAPAGEKAQLNQLYSDYKAQLSEAESQVRHLDRFQLQHRPRNLRDGVDRSAQRREHGAYGPAQGCWRSAPDPPDSRGQQGRRVRHAERHRQQLVALPPLPSLPLPPRREGGAACARMLQAQAPTRAVKGSVMCARQHLPAPAWWTFTCAR